MGERRPSWPEYFMSLAKVAARRSSCLRRKVGAVLVKNKQIIAMGYNGSPSGYDNCCDLEFCRRNNLDSGKSLDICPAVHAEANCINQAARFGHSTEGAVMYVTHHPCKWCLSSLVNAGIKTVIYDEPYPSELSESIKRQCDIEVVSFKDVLRNLNIKNKSNI